MGAVGTLAPILWELWGQCPHSKINDITNNNMAIPGHTIGNAKTWSTLVFN